MVARHVEAWFFRVIGETDHAVGARPEFGELAEFPIAEHCGAVPQRLW